MLQFPDAQRRGQQAFRARNSFVGACFIGGKFLVYVLLHIVLVPAALTRTTPTRLRRSHAARTFLAYGRVTSAVHSDREPLLAPCAPAEETELVSRRRTVRQADSYKTFSVLRSFPSRSAIRLPSFRNSLTADDPERRSRNRNLNRGQFVFSPLLSGFQHLAIGNKQSDFQFVPQLMIS